MYKIEGWGMCGGARGSVEEGRDIVGSGERGKKKE